MHLYGNHTYQPSACEDGFLVSHCLDCSCHLLSCIRQGNGCRHPGSYHGCLPGQKRNSYFHHIVAVNIGQLGVSAHLVPRADIQFLDISCVGGFVGVSAVIAQGVIIIFQGVFIGGLGSAQGIHRAGQLGLHAGLINFIEHLVLFHLVPLLKAGR